MADSKEKGKFKFGFKPEMKFKVSDEDLSVDDKLAKLQAELELEQEKSGSAAHSSFKNQSSKASATGSSALSKAKTSSKKEPDSDTNQSARTHMAVFWGMVLLVVVLSKLPIANILFVPLNQFTTMIHELGHAFAAIVTGGIVNGLTIVSDGQGHGGLTFSQGGIPFFIIQAGYLGTTIAGCGLVYLSQFKKWSRTILLGLGVVTLFVVLLMSKGLFSMQVVPAFFSILWALAMAAVLIFSGLKLKERTANLFLLFLAIQTATDSLNSIVIVLQGAMMGSAITSDATAMQAQFFLPAIFWSLSWALISVALLAVTVWYTYGAGIFQGKTPKPAHSGITSKGTKPLLPKKTKGK